MLTLTRSVQGDAVWITLEGRLNEKARLDPVALDGGTRFIIDVNDLVGLNSLGLRTWITWIDSLRLQTEKIEFRGVSKALIFQFNTVRGMYPKGATIHSLEIPMVCDTCGHEEDKKWTFAQPISANLHPDDELATLKVEGCEKPDCDYKPEFEKDRYFRFLSIS